MFIDHIRSTSVHMIVSRATETCISKRPALMLPHWLHMAAQAMPQSMLIARRRVAGMQHSYTPLNSTPRMRTLQRSRQDLRQRQALHRESSSSNRSEAGIRDRGKDHIKLQYHQHRTRRARHQEDPTNTSPTSRSNCSATIHLRSFPLSPVSVRRSLDLS